MGRYEDTLPRKVAIEQRAYERRMQTVRGREAGLKLREIGAHLGVGKETARVIVWRGVHAQGHASPIERYLNDTSDLVAMARIIRLSRRRYSRISGTS